MQIVGYMQKGFIECSKKCFRAFLHICIYHQDDQDAQVGGPECETLDVAEVQSHDEHN